MRSGQGATSCKSIIVPSYLIFVLTESGELKMSTDIEVYVKGKKLKMNEFVTSIINDVMLAILNNLRDVDIDRISKIQIE
jgi:hypothetical protein